MKSIYLLTAAVGMIVLVAPFAARRPQNGHVILSLVKTTCDRLTNRSGN